MATQMKEADREAVRTLHGFQDTLDERYAHRYLIWIMTLGLIGVLIWASSFNLDEVTQGNGKVIPTSREQVIQSLDPGVLTELYVKEGDQVQKDQVLLRIDDARSGPLYREGHEKLLALVAQAARLQAEAYSTPLTFPIEVQDFPTLIKREEQAYLARRQALDEQIEAMERALDALSREIDLIKPLVGQGVISQVELLRLTRQQADMHAMRSERRNRYFTEANNELVRVESDLAQVRENTMARKDAFKRTVIRSPMNGVVKNVQVTTIGAVIQAGQSILEIVPVNDEMLVEGYVKPSEVAFLYLGQPVMVKLTAFDYNRYGGLEGVLEHVSPDTMKDESKARKPGTNPVDLDEGFYRILVRITDENRERNGRVLSVVPGMTATIEIKTGQKTVLAYLFRPIQAMTEALRER